MSTNRNRSRNYMGVIYNFTDPNKHHGMNGFFHMGTLMEDKLSPSLGGFLKYFCYGEEICPTTQTPHLQCFFVFKNDESLANLRVKFTALFGFECTIAFKVADTNTEACIEYCGKDGSFREFGQRPKGKGKRSDLEAVVAIIKNGGDMRDVANHCPQAFIRCGAGIGRYYATLAPSRNFKSEVYWLHGPTGSGKSRWAMNQVDRSDCYLKNGTTKWWCGYTGQKDVIIDDFRPTKEMPFEFLLTLMDRYPMMVEIKGGSIPFTSHRIFFTTPLPPTETWTRCEWLTQENLAQFSRRLDRVIEFTTTQEPLAYAHLPFPEAPPEDMYQNTVKRPRKDFSIVLKSLQNSKPTTGGTTGAIRQDLFETADSQDENEVSGDEEPEDGASIGSQSTVECDYVTSDEEVSTARPRRNIVYDSDDNTPDLC